MIQKVDRNLARRRRHVRVRKRVFGVPDRPRLGVFRSEKHIYAQVIDDTEGVTLAAASSLDPALRDRSGATVEAAAEVGRLIAERALAKGIQKVVFDRSGYLYHGRVAALAAAAREAGLQF